MWAKAKTVLHAIVRATGFLFLVALYSCESEQATAEHLAFEVVDSLLGPVQQMSAASLSFRPPLGFLPVPDSLLQPLQEELTNQVGNREGIELKHAYIDQDRGAGLLVSLIPGLRRSGDTATFVGKYRQSLARQYGAQNVKAGDFWVDNVYVKNFLVTDSVHVRIQLLCLSDEGDAAELQYVAPRVIYPDIVKTFESSIGSLNSLKGGG